jgi:methylenetetrahydrofolate reductase (NADPH)
MKVIEHLERATQPLISFEIIPPQRGGRLDSLVGLIEDLAQFNPPFIDITSHAAEVIYEETEDGVQKRIKRKRPGTMGICALIQNKYDIDAVPHVLCEGFTRQETEDFLIELHFLGIDNVLAIRGDDSGYQKPLEHGRSRNVHASDLIAQIADMNKGEFLEELLDASPTDFCVGAAAYPEKHFEAPNLTADVARVKEKVDSGASYVVTQMFFDNAHYYDLVEECRGQGITVPIIPGLKTVTTKRHLTTIPKNFYCELPVELAEAVSAVEDDKVSDVGAAWALEQTRDLLDHDVPAVHFYVMGNARAIGKIVPQIGLS